MKHRTSQAIIVSLMLISQSNRFVSLLYPEQEGIKMTPSPRRQSRHLDDYSRS